MDERAKARVRKLAKEGLNSREIAQRFGVSHSRINNILKEKENLGFVPDEVAHA